jgi:uncharacterized protein YodC (DUF2158 family)
VLTREEDLHPHLGVTSAKGLAISLLNVLIDYGVPIGTGLRAQPVAVMTEAEKDGNNSTGIIEIIGIVAAQTITTGTEVVTTEGTPEMTVPEISIAGTVPGEMKTTGGTPEMTVPEISIAEIGQGEMNHFRLEGSMIIEAPGTSEGAGMRGGIPVGAVTEEGKIVMVVIGVTIPRSQKSLKWSNL